MKLRNINPLGQVDVPLLGREDEPIGEHGRGCLEPGEEFDVTEEHARQLLGQEGNYEPADDEATALLVQLRAEAAAEEQDTPEDQPPATGAQATGPVPPATANPSADPGQDGSTAQEGNS